MAEVARAFRVGVCAGASPSGLTGGAGNATAGGAADGAGAGLADWSMTELANEAVARLAKGSVAFAAPLNIWMIYLDDRQRCDTEHRPIHWHPQAGIIHKVSDRSHANMYNDDQHQR